MDQDNSNNNLDPVDEMADILGDELGKEVSGNAIKIKKVLILSLFSLVQPLFCVLCCAAQCPTSCCGCRDSVWDSSKMSSL
jgi:hypothetical protein